jgi:hypothetical protein
MPHYKHISAKEILARVIRGTGYKLPSVYQDDILEWIAEGIGYIQTTQTLVTESTAAQDCPGELLVTNHCVGLPCGFVSILALEDEFGNRIPEGGDITDITLQTSSRHKNNQSTQDTRISTFEVNPYQHQTSSGVPSTKPGTSVPIFGEDITSVKNTPYKRAYYKIQGNCIQTSFESGYVRLHYLALPVDEEGYPTIPDNENFKQALEWHIIRRLIGAGYQHPVFTWEKADEQFEKYAGRAMNEVSFASLDTRARTWRSTVRLIPPQSYSDDFFIGSESPELLYK